MECVFMKRHQFISPSPSCFSPWGYGLLHKVYTGRLRPVVQPFSSPFPALLYAILTGKVPLSCAFNRKKKVFLLLPFITGPFHQ